MYWCQVRIKPAKHFFFNFKLKNSTESSISPHTGYCPGNSTACQACFIIQQDYGWTFSQLPFPVLLKASLSPLSPLIDYIPRTPGIEDSKDSQPQYQMAELWFWNYVLSLSTLQLQKASQLTPWESLQESCKLTFAHSVHGPCSQILTKLPIHSRN